MQVIVDGIRKIVVLVLLMELVLQMQSGKQYEPYIKILVGIMVVYSLINGIFGAWGSMEQRYLKPMQDFSWSGDWYVEFEKKAGEQTENEVSSEKANIHIDTIEIEKIKVKEVDTLGGMP